MVFLCRQHVAVSACSDYQHMNPRAGKGCSSTTDGRNCHYRGIPIKVGAFSLRTMPAPKTPTPTSAQVTIAIALFPKRKAALRANVFLSPASSQQLIACATYLGDPSVGDVAFLKSRKNPWRRNLDAVEMALSRSQRHGWDVSSASVLSRIEIEVFDESENHMHPLVTVVSIDLDSRRATIFDGDPDSVTNERPVPTALVNGQVWPLVNRVISDLVGLPPSVRKTAP